LDFFKPKIAPLKSAVPQNPTLVPNMKWIVLPVAQIWVVASTVLPTGLLFFLDEI